MQEEFNDDDDDDGGGGRGGGGGDGGGGGGGGDDMNKIIIKNYILGTRAPMSQDGLRRLLKDDNQGDFWLEKHLSILISVCLTALRYFLYQVATNCVHEAGWNPFQILYFQKISSVQQGI